MIDGALGTKDGEMKEADYSEWIRKEKQGEDGKMEDSKLSCKEREVERIAVSQVHCSPGYKEKKWKMEYLTYVYS